MAEQDALVTKEILEMPKDDDSSVFTKITSLFGAKKKKGTSSFQPCFFLIPSLVVSHPSSFHLVLISWGYPVPYSHHITPTLLVIFCCLILSCCLVLYEQGVGVKWPQVEGREVGVVWGHCLSVNIFERAQSSL